MTNYGTIPASSHPPIDLESISQVKHRIKSGLSTRRPWRSMFDLNSIKFPNGIIESFTRIKTNLILYRANYAIVFLSILFLSLIYHPTSLIVLAILIVLWIFLYFLRDDALKVYGHQIDDKTVLIGLLVLTIGLLLLTGATGNIVWSLVVAVSLVLVHAVVRRCDDLVADDDVVAVTEVSGLTSYPSS